LISFDFWLFDHIKTSFAGRVFNDSDELLEAVIEFLNEIQPFELQLSIALVVSQNAGT
jgi:hypothetical protein